MRQALREVDEAREWMLTLGPKTASEKVASFLRLVAAHLDTVGEPGEPQLIELPMTRGDIVDFLGLTIGTVSREFTRLRNEALIATSGKRHVRIIDLDRLTARCG